MENLTKHSIECSSFRDPPQALPETQLCVSSLYSLWSSDCKAISMPRQGLSWRAMEEDRPAGCRLCSRACTMRERF
uniref:Uncharacterized protein n=1 Tax=Gorilla gorilla gorilla TaxID=9595 RepID=A0A2I2YS65_GORGO